MIGGLLNDPTGRALQAALNGLSLRQQIIGNNLANVDTPGYHASEVTFEERLHQAMAEPASHIALVSTNPRHLAGRPALSTEVTRVQATTDSPVRNDGNNVDVDREMARLAETQITYQAMTQLASGRLSLLRTIITEGRR